MTNTIHKQRRHVFILLTLALSTSLWAQKKLEVVAALKDIRPGNIAVSKSGRVFSSVHPLASPKIQLVEIINGKAIPYPNSSLQKNGAKASDQTMDAPLGIVADKNNHIWLVDIGTELGKVRIWNFDVNTNKLAEKIEVPLSVAPKGSFVQDLAIDEENGWAYLADIAPTAIIAINLKTKQARRFSNPVLGSENADMKIDGKVIMFQGKPARVGINPITLSNDRKTLYFGSMNGTAYYKVPTKLFRDGKSDQTIAKAITKAGPKPMSDGACTDAYGNHYFTNLQEHAISKLDTNGKLTTLVKDSRLSWPDNVAVSPDGKYIYIDVNQNHLSPAFTGKADQGVPPYYVFRYKLK